ncbi:hypothetical protein [Deinococcus sp.]|uniref:hypothetical protein n=1 Tax=Deinococcus sp. TaxID=47478 RepID=UPI0025BF15B1|nr:hypothetical protein [Deinococcus sp.]
MNTLTPRLTLRPLTPDDLPSVLAHGNEPQVAGARGCVGRGKTYEQALCRETQEELDLRRPETTRATARPGRAFVTRRLCQTHLKPGMSLAMNLERLQAQVTQSLMENQA